MTPVAAATARATIARLWLGDPAAVDAADAMLRLGQVVLRPYQRDAVRELGALLKAAGGALLADEVGLGKTYVALALASASERPLVIAPAALHRMWERACVATGTRATLIATEALSRSRTAAGPLPRTDLIIVDEAHHFRTPTTRRYRALATLAATAPLLLLSATPVHNHPRDLAALLALFLGARAWTLDDARRAAYIVRRTHAIADTTGEVPAVTAPVVLAVGDDSATLEALLALPPSVPPRDGGDGGALVVHGLVRQWASSGGALRAALGRRLERAVAMAAALERGRYPAYRELRAWCTGEGAVQLGFPEVLIPAAPSGDGLLECTHAHAAGVRALLDALGRRPDPDIARAERLRAIRARHPGAGIVAFSAYEDTVRALYRVMRADAGLCALGATGATVAGGTLTRAEAIARFAPVASHAPPPRAADRIEVLLTTDLLSEGINLQDAAVVVHLDLPWTAARMEQRVGRVARLGSRHRRIAVYLLAPPAASEVVLGVERRLHDKLAAAARAVGVAGSILPPSVLEPLTREAPGAPRAGEAEHLARARALVARWRPRRRDRDATIRHADHMPLCAAVRADADGVLAACVIGGTPVVLASLGGPVTDRASVVARAIACVDGAPDLPTCSVDEAASARAAIVAWGERWLAQRDGGLGDGELSRERRRVLGRIARIARRAPLDRRPALGSLARAARAAATAPGGVAAEWRLGVLADDVRSPDEAWLRAVAQGVPPPTVADVAPATGVVTVHALILLRRVAA